MLELSHKNLEIWKISIQFVSDIYKLTANFPPIEQYGITNQLRRAAVSIPSNISEGAARRSSNESKRYYDIARSSLVEIDTQIEISKIMNRLFALLSGLIKSIS